MIVWVEGVDGSGKSELVKKLRETYGYGLAPIPTHRPHPTDAQAEAERQKWCEWFSKYHDNYKPLIAERGHISEIIYRINDGDKTYLNADMLAEHMQGTKIILCKTETAFEDAMKRGEDSINTLGIHSKIQNDYDVIVAMLCKFFGCDCMNYDWRKQDISEVIKFINN